jgi:molybdopterin-guanine dinucleotide biosynthesis protein MobB
VKIIAVLGSKNSGKTATIEALVKELTERGHQIVAVKHIPKKDFTMDSPGKDTWRFAQAGAQTIIAISEKETTILHKRENSSITLEGIIESCGEKASMVILEGFRSLVGRDVNIPKIVAVKSVNEVNFALKSYRPIIAFTGKLENGNIKTSIPYINISKEPRKLADLVEKHIGKGKNRS